MSVDDRSEAWVMAGVPRRPPSQQARQRRSRPWQQWARRMVFSYWGLGALVLLIGILAGKYFVNRAKQEEERMLKADREYQLGNQMYKRGQVEDASRKFERAVELFPKHVYALSNLGTCLRELGQHDKAVLAHRRAVSIMPDRARNHYNLAVSLQTAGDPRGAIESYRASLALDEQQPDAYFNLGVALQDLGEMQNATAAYRRTLELDPSNFGAACNRCNIFQFEGHLDEAEECYKQVIRRHPRYDRAYTNLAGTLYVKGDLGGAAALYLKALEINPQNAIASHALDALRGSKIEGASKEYLAELFDSYSGSFDASLAELEYKSPQLLRRAVDDYLRTEDGQQLNISSWRVLDAGCGTGLSGADFRNISSYLAGVDISRKMVHKAAERSIYDHLITGDMTQTLAEFASDPFDLIISADVLVYYGNIDFLLVSFHRALKRHVGLLAFTVEALEEGSSDGWVLRQTGRYAHTQSYVTSTASRCGLEVLSATSMSPRQDQGKPIQGLLFLMRRKD